MSVEVLDGATIRDFIEDEISFNSFVLGRFAALDADLDGLLSYAEMVEELESIAAMNGHLDGVDEAAAPADLRQVCRSLFSQFDRDGNGVVDLEEFKSEMREMLLAVANGLGFLPVKMVLEESSLLRKAVDRELAMIALP